MCGGSDGREWGGMMNSSCSCTAARDGKKEQLSIFFEITSGGLFLLALILPPAPRLDPPSHLQDFLCRQHSGQYNLGAVRAP